MLIGNYSVFNKSPIRFMSGTSQCDRSSWNLSGSSRNMYFNDFSGFTTGSGVITTHLLYTYGKASGSVPPYSWIIPQVAGGMAMRTTGSASNSFDLIPQQPTSIDLTGSGTLSATASLLIAMLCAMTGSGSLTASISGNGNITTSMTGTGNLTADITAFGNMIVDLIGTGILNGDITSIGNMSIDITVTGSGLTTANVGPAVWDALAILSNNPGTMGELLNNAGGGATPSTIAAAVWDELKNSHNTPDSYGKIVQDLEALVKQIKALTSANL